MTPSRSDAHGPTCWLVFLDEMVLTSAWFSVETVVPELAAGAPSRFSSGLKVPPSLFRASLMAQMVKRLPAVWETRVKFLGGEDPLEKEMTTHSSTLAWNIPWIENHDRLQSSCQGCKEPLRDFAFTFHHFSLCTCSLPFESEGCCYLSGFLLHGT